MNNTGFLEIGLALHPVDFYGRAQKEPRFEQNEHGKLTLRKSMSKDRRSQQARNRKALRQKYKRIFKGFGPGFKVWLRRISQG